MTITKQEVGSRLVIFIQDSKPQVRQEMYHFYFNWNSVDSGLKQLGEGVSYFVTTKKKFVKGMASNLFGKLVDFGISKSYKGKPDLFKKRAQLGAQCKLNELKEVHLLPDREVLTMRLKREIID